MCFYNEDYDWVAYHVEDSVVVSPEPHRCCECRNPIYGWTPARRVYMAEYETEEEWRNDQSPPDGEVFDPESDEFWMCLKCKGVLRVELAEGCHKNEAQPQFGELYEALRNDDDGRYAKAAIEDDPSLADHIRDLLGD